MSKNDLGAYICDQCGTNIKNRPISHLERRKLNFCNRACVGKYRNPSGKSSKTGGIDIKLYSRVHQWLVRVAGKAKTCIKCNREGLSKYEWALKKGCEYEKKVENFMQMCCSCHRKYDETEIRRKKLSASLMGHPAPNRRAIVVLNSNTMEEMPFPSIKKAADSLSISRTGIQQVLSGALKTIGGYTCRYQ